MENESTFWGVSYQSKMSTIMTFALTVNQLCSTEQSFFHSSIAGIDISIQTLRKVYNWRFYANGKDLNCLFIELHSANYNCVILQ